MAASIVFAFALLGLAALFAAKLREISRGSAESGKIRRRGDALVFALRRLAAESVPAAAARAAVAGSRLAAIPKAVGALVRRAEEKARARAAALVRGRAFNGKKGPVSFFLRNVSEHRNGIRSSGEAGTE